MPFHCRADDFVIIDPPGRLRGLDTSLASIEEREDGLYAFVEIQNDDGSAVRVEIVFRAPWAYCVSNEGQRILTAHRIVAAIGKAGLLHRVEGSEWLDRFVEESDQTCRGPLEHYLIVTDDDWVDVVAQGPPEVRIV